MATDTELNIGNKVKIKNYDGTYEFGKVVTISYSPMKYSSYGNQYSNEYGIKFENTKYIRYLRAYDLTKIDDKFEIDAKCVCGSATLKHPGHDWYCEIELNKKIKEKELKK